MTVQAIRGVVESAIQQASKATGVDFGFLLGAARRESGYNPGAKAHTSSAAGLFQFVEQTWLATLKRHGAKYGYGQFAEAISQGADGRYHVADKARQAVMDLRLDPHAASLMAGELASDHASYLRGRVGRDPTAGELYAAHFLGPQASAKLIEAVQTRPGASAAALFPEAAAANHAVFHRDGRTVTVAELYHKLGEVGSGSAAPADPDPPGYVHDAAALGRIQQAEQERAILELVLRGPESPDSGGGSLGGSMFSTEMLKLLSDARRS